MPTSKENLRINWFVADLILFVFKNSRFLSLRPSFLFLSFFNVRLWYFQGFLGSLAGEESTCNAGDHSLIPGWGRCPGEEIGYPLQYSWASLVAPLVKNPPAMPENLGLIPGLGKSPGRGHGNPLLYSCLENLHGQSQNEQLRQHSMVPLAKPLRSQKPSFLFKVLVIYKHHLPFFSLLWCFFLSSS